MRKELEELYAELESVQRRTEDYLPDYGFSSKEEIIQLINEDIAELEREETESECDYTEIEKERSYLCKSQGISRYC